MLGMFKGFVNAFPSFVGCAEDPRLEIVGPEENKISLPRPKHGQKWGLADMKYILEVSYFSKLSSVSMRRRLERSVLVVIRM